METHGIVEPGGSGLSDNLDRWPMGNAKWRQVCKLTEQSVHFVAVTKKEILDSDKKT